MTSFVGHGAEFAPGARGFTADGSDWVRGRLGETAAGQGPS
jgi:hypothetical protein